MINNNFIKIRNLSKSYEINYNKLTIINELSLDLQKNCIVSIVSSGWREGLPQLQSEPGQSIRPA